MTNFQMPEPIVLHIGYGGVCSFRGNGQVIRDGEHIYTADQVREMLQSIVQKIESEILK